VIIMTRRGQQASNVVAGLADKATRRSRAAFPAGKTFDAWDERLSPVPAPTQSALRTLERVGRHENLVVCGPSGKGVIPLS
jgi:DNA replication protein DnaC